MRSSASPGAAEPPALDWPYLRWALRDLAIAEGWLTEHPPGWARLRDSAPLYVVIAHFFCLPLQNHRARHGCWEPTTVVNEHEQATWAQALELGRVRLPPPPPQPPRRAAGRPAGAGARRRRPARPAGGHAPTGHPVPSGTAADTTARWRAWRTERDLHRRQLERERATRTRARAAPARALPGARAPAPRALAARAAARLPAHLAGRLPADAHQRPRRNRGEPPAKPPRRSRAGRDAPRCVGIPV
jgi:hypothetical protein